MMQSTPDNRKDRRTIWASLHATVTFAGWQIQSVWQFFLLAGLGLLVVITIASTIPLFTRVATTAGLRTLLSNDPLATYAVVWSPTSTISPAAFRQATQTIERNFQQETDQVFPEAAERSLRLTNTSPFHMHGKEPIHQVRLDVNGFDFDHVHSQIQMNKGRLPETRYIQGNPLEIAVTHENAIALQIDVGDTITIYPSVTPQGALDYKTPLHLNVSGIFTQQDKNAIVWHNTWFDPIDKDGFTLTQALVDTDALLAALDTLAMQQSGEGVSFSVDQFWYTRLELSTLDIQNANQLQAQLQLLASRLPVSLYAPPYIPESQVLAGGMIATLQGYHERVGTTALPINVLLALIQGLCLLFLSILVDVLVDRQAEAITQARNRGATFRQLLAIFVTQSLWLILLAALIGPWIALFLVMAMVYMLLPKTNWDVLEVLSFHPHVLYGEVGWYVFITIGVAFVTMLFSVWSVLHRQMCGRSVSDEKNAQRPFWQRMYLDVLALLFAGGSYGGINALSSTGILDARLQVLLVGPCLLIATTLLILGGLLLFFRFFPFLLYLAASLFRHARGLNPRIPFQLMAKASRQMVRVTLLLTLSISFAVFLLTFMATQSQRTSDVADYWAGADFSGNIQSALGNYSEQVSFERVQAAYQNIPGSTAAAIAHINNHIVADDSSSLKVLAIDPETFENATLWLPRDKPQISTLLSKLAAARTTFTAETDNITTLALPVIVDTATWNYLHLHDQSVFRIFTAYGEFRLVVVGRVEHIPSVNDMMSLETSGEAGVLVDYESYRLLYQRLFQMQQEEKLTANAQPPVVNANYAWIRVPQTPEHTVQIQRVLEREPLALDSMHVRSAMLTSLQNDPFYVSLIGVAALGIVVPLVLALVGFLLSSLLTIHTRLNSIAVLRALGISRGQLMLFLGWEQGIIALVALVPGLFSGFAFTAVVLPHLLFTGGGVTSQAIWKRIEHISVFLVQSTPPLHIVVPPTVMIAVGFLLAMGLLASGLIIYRTVRPSVAHTLHQEEFAPVNLPVPYDDRGIERERSREQISASVRQRYRRIHLLLELFAFGSKQMHVSRLSMLLTWFGMLIALLLVCVVPLLTYITTTAGLQRMLTQPENASVTLVEQVDTRQNAPSSLTDMLAQTQEAYNHYFLSKHKKYFSSNPAFLVHAHYRNQTGPDQKQGELSLRYSGIPAKDLSEMLKLEQGHFPCIEASEIEVLITLEDAAQQQITVGDLIPTDDPAPLHQVRVVGLFHPRLQFEYLHTGSSAISTEKGVHVVAVSEAILSVLDQMPSQATIDENPALNVTFTHSYAFATEQLTIDDLEGLQHLIQNLPEELSDVRLSPSQVRLGSPKIPLQQFAESIVIARIPTIMVTLLILALTMLFLSLMAEMIVECQAEMIAVLRSRGATRHQIFVGIAAQGCVLGLLAGIVALFCIPPLVVVLGQRIVTESDQAILDLLITRPLSLLWIIRWYLVGGLVVILTTLNIAFFRAGSLNVLSFRREETRSTHRPLWQRLYLDVVGLLIALLCYGFTHFITNARLLDPSVNMYVRSPLLLLTALSLIWACTLLFLRILPLLLRLSMRFATRSRGISPTLAFAELGRLPHKRLRSALLLLFATGLIVFAFIVNASQRQHITAVSTYWTGADFAGSIPKDEQKGLSSPEERYKNYRKIPGVEAVAMGFTIPFDLPVNTVIYRAAMIATDPEVFQQATFWTGQEDRAQQNMLMARLIEQRTALEQELAHIERQQQREIQVPVIVGASAQRALNISVGQNLVVPFGFYSLTFQVVGIVTHIPTTNDTQPRALQDTENASTSPVNIGMLVDYRSFVAASQYAQDQVADRFREERTHKHFPMDRVWLRTSDDPVLLTHIRNSLGKGQLRLVALIDRRAAIETLQEDPLAVNLFTLLMLGIALALILALCGGGVVALLSAHERQSHLRVLYALGSTLQQVFRVVAWEQGIVSVVAVLLGAAGGVLFSILTLPALILTSRVPGVQNASEVFMHNYLASISLFTIQDVPPVIPVLPPYLFLIVSGIIGVVVFVGVLGIACISFWTPSAQALRVSRD